MKTKELVLISLLLAMGTVLHLVIPGIGAGMKPDMLLVMMFLGIILFPNKKNVLLIGVLGGLLAALTTTFPAGQIPNIIDKPLTAFIFYGLFLSLGRFRQSTVVLGALTAVGVFISGIIFLGSAALLFQLPDAFFALVVGVVLPAVALSAIVMFIFHPIATKLVKRFNLEEKPHTTTM